MVIHETHGTMCKHSSPGEWKLHSTVIIAGDMIDDWLDDRINEPEEHCNAHDVAISLTCRGTT